MAKFKISNNRLGQATSSASAPVVIASDQSNIGISLNQTGFFYSSVNSTTTQLNASAIFTGAIESVLSQPAYSILFFSDQNATITINQFIDAGGTKNIQQQVFTYTASSKFARSGAMNGDYFQVVIQNTGASLTTTLQLDTSYGAIFPATQLNNTPVSVNEINGSVVDSGAGNKTTGTQRVTLATDDTNLSSINSHIPALTLGQSASASSLAVTLANENLQDLYVIGQSAQTATVNNILTTTAGTASTDVLQYRAFTCQVVSTGTGGTFIFEGCNDNTNFVTINVYNESAGSGAAILSSITASASTILYAGACMFRYIRLRIATTITGGSIQAFTIFTQTPYSRAVTAVAQASASNLSTQSSGNAAHSAASVGNPVRTAGRVVPTTIATVDTTLVAGDVSDLGFTSNQQLIIKENSTSELDFSIPTSSAATVVTVQGLVAPSGTASVRNYIKSLRVSNDALGAAGNLWILDSIVSVTSIAITTGLVTTGTHDLRIGDAIVFTALAAGTGVTANQIYYVTTVASATTFNFSATQGGSNVVPSVAYTGTSMYRVFDQIRLQTSASTQFFTYNQPLKGIANTITNFLIPTSLTSGNVYITANGYRGF